MSARLTTSIVFLCFVFFLTACDQQQARRPIQQSKSQHVENSVQKNQIQLAHEIEIIEQWVLAQESTFSETDHGVYYSFDNLKNRPVLDVENLQKIYVRFEQFDGVPIYDWKIFQNPMTNQDVPQGVVLSLPYIPIGVESTLVLTSFLAYGSSGDGSLIAPYTPIVARIYIPLNQNK
tara:strand:- start:515 stop:1045 length:531 start_codon:yes stop_codon:yes gene_type:complete